MSTEVAITGMGVVSCLGPSLGEHWKALLSGRSGISELAGLPADGWPCRYAGQAGDADAGRWVSNRKALRTLPRTSVHAFAAVGMALQDAGLADALPENTAIVMGTGMIDYELADLEPAARVSVGPDGELDLAAYGRRGIPQVYPLFPVKMLNNATMCQIAMQYQIKGPNATFSPFGEAGAQAIGEGFRLVESGAADVAVVGGYSLTAGPQAMARFSLMQLLTAATRPPRSCCRPFDRGRDGMVLGEGAGALVLEPLPRVRARGGRVHARLAGYGCATRPGQHGYPTAEAVEASLRVALDEAGLAPADLGYIHADAPGLGTDICEAAGIAAALGPATGTVPVSSSKGASGHLLAGAAPVELAVTVLAMAGATAPPTTNLSEPFPGCPLRVSGEATRAPMRSAACLSAGFGGQSVALVVTEPGG